MRRMLRPFSGAPNSALNGTYVFDFAGVDGLNGLSQIGEFNADGAGNITSGSIDINDGGTLSQFQFKGRNTACTPAPLPAPQPPPFPLSSYSIVLERARNIDAHYILPLVSRSGF